MSDALFIGRDMERQQFLEALEDPRGQAILIVGQEGMGKTALAQRMVGWARKHPRLRCSAILYEITDSQLDLFHLMLDHAYLACERQSSFAVSPKRRDQWKALLSLVPKGDQLVNLFEALRREPERHIRDRLLAALEGISAVLDPDQRALFVIDPYTYLPQATAEDWKLLVRNLPRRIKWVLAQRPDDVLAGDGKFLALPAVVKIPPDELARLSEAAIADRLQHLAAKLGTPVAALTQAFLPYDGHPFAVSGALELLAAGHPLETLPTDPSGVASSQWRKICGYGPEAIKLFKAYACLEVTVPDPVVRGVAGLDPDTLDHLLAQSFLRGLLRRGDGGKKIYHGLLAAHIVRELDAEEAKPYHRRAVEVYRKRLSAGREPDHLAARRLAGHALRAEGEDAYVEAVAEVSGEVLWTLGLLDEAAQQVEKALHWADPQSAEAATLLIRRGRILRTQGRFEEAAMAVEDALKVSRARGDIRGTGSCLVALGVIYRKWGSPEDALDLLQRAIRVLEETGEISTDLAAAHANLGAVYHRQGRLEMAEHAYARALTLHRELDDHQGIAQNTNSLAKVYRDRGAREGQVEDLRRAEAMAWRAWKANERLGRREGVAKQQGSLGLIYGALGDLERSEALHRQSLELNRSLGRREGVAIQLANLGRIYQRRGDLAKTRDCWREARRLYAALDKAEGVRKMDRWLGELAAV
jgi:tetratricopeptide (TPR) repeat protein